MLRPAGPANPAADEFRSLQPNEALMEDLAERTGGRVLALSDLAQWAKELPTKTIACDGVVPNPAVAPAVDVRRRAAAVGHRVVAAKEALVAMRLLLLSLLLLPLAKLDAEVDVF